VLLVEHFVQNLDAPFGIGIISKSKNSRKSIPINGRHQGPDRQIFMGQSGG